MGQRQAKRSLAVPSKIVRKKQFKKYFQEVEERVRPKANMNYLMISLLLLNVKKGEGVVLMPILTYLLNGPFNEIPDLSYSRP